MCTDYLNTQFFEESNINGWLSTFLLDEKWYTYTKNRDMTHNFDGYEPQFYFKPIKR